MRARKFGRIVNITSAMVKSPHPAMGLSTAARAGLTALSKALSREVVIDNVTINNLLPERFDTPRQEFMAQRLMKRQGIDRDEARRQIADTIPAKRFGEPDEFGAACAFLCSVRRASSPGRTCSWTAVPTTASSDHHDNASLLPNSSGTRLTCLTRDGSTRSHFPEDCGPGYAIPVHIIDV